MVIDFDTNNPIRLQVQQGTSQRRPYDRQAARSRRRGRRKGSKGTVQPGARSQWAQSWMSMRYSIISLPQLRVSSVNGLLPAMILSVAYILPPWYLTFPPLSVFCQPFILYLFAIAAIRLILPGRRINIPVLPSQHGRSGSGVWTFLSSDWTYNPGTMGFDVFLLFLCHAWAVLLFCHRHIVCMRASFIYPRIFSTGVLRVFFSTVSSEGSIWDSFFAFRIAVTIILTPISRYIPPPIRLSFSLCSIISPVCFLSSWTFVYLRLWPVAPSFLHPSFSLRFIAFACFYNGLGWLLVVYRVFLDKAPRLIYFFVIY